PVAQFAYRIDPVAFPPSPLNAFKINGVPDILWLGNNKLLVTERSFSTGIPGCVIKLYLADLDGATDISNINSVKNRPGIVPLSKKLLLNMNSLGIYIDNIEGATFGPDLDGNRSLIFVADDNFASDQKTQFLLFKIK
ncbi:MAG TPA: esterase-like activity of phytase family protein, partial [Flavisolibacter sp.]|nr:esterase-like activity of phytase family protein [Flavisolibacter sp.]